MSDGPKLPWARATNLWVTFCWDGRLLLELLAGWYTVLAVAECAIEDADTVTQVLARWAGSDHPPHETDRFPDGGRSRHELGALRRRYSRGYGQGFAKSVNEGQFQEVFGGATPADPQTAEAFAKQLARAINSRFRQARAKAQARLAGGVYLAVLEEYLEQLRAQRSDPRGYRRIEHTIARIIEDEHYLRVAEDERARRAIAAIDDELSYLYGRCMDVER